MSHGSAMSLTWDDHRVLLDQVEERRQPVDLVELAGQGGGQVEAEPVHVHLGHPVAQRVHDQLQRVRVPTLQAVPGPGGVVVELRVVGHQPVVGGVVDALDRQHRAQVVALGGVVVDDVEDHLDAGLVQRPDHRLELGDLLAPLAAGRRNRCAGRGSRSSCSPSSCAGPARPGGSRARTGAPASAPPR